MSSQSTNTARHFFREFQTQTSVESLAKIQEEAVEEPEKPLTPEIPKKIWGPIDFPVAEISKITHSSCEVRHRVLNHKSFETGIRWYRIKAVINPIKVAVSRKCHLLYNLMYSNVQRIKFATNFKTRRFCYNRMNSEHKKFCIFLKYFRLKSRIWLQMKSTKFLSLPLTFKIIIRNQNICGSEQEEFVSSFKSNHCNLL